MRRSRKPHVRARKGKLYYRITWTENGKRREREILIGPEAEEHTAAFDARYWQIKSGQAPELQRAPSTSFDALCRSYLASPFYFRTKKGKLKSESTKRAYRRIIEDLRAKNGSVDVKRIAKAEVRSIHEKLSETPRKADYYLQVIKLLLNYAKDELEWITSNPAEGIAQFGTQEEFKDWPERAQAAFKRAAADDWIALTAFYLGTGTGQRPGDLPAMKWDHYDGEFISVVQEKTGERLDVACPGFLRDYLDTLPKRGAFILAKNLTQPFSKWTVRDHFNAARERAGKVCERLVMHGWRVTAAVALAEAGASDAEIQAVTGHRTASMAAKYRKRAGQRKLSKAAQARRK